MNSDERVRRTLNGEDVDRPATFDLMLNDSVIRHFAGGDVDLANPRPTVHRAYDRALDSSRMAIVYPQAEGEELLANGALRQKKRWTTWSAPKIDSVDDAERILRENVRFLKENPVADLNPIIEEYCRTQAEFSDFFLFGNFMLKTGIMFYSGIGLDWFSYLLADQPRLVSEYYEASTARAVRSIENARFPAEIEAVFDCEDIAFRGGTIFGPEYLRKEFFPRLERLVDAWHRKGIKFVFHSDGNLMSVVADLAACGIDALNPIETQAGMNVTELREKASELVFIGGVDCSQILPRGTPQDVAQETRRVLAASGPRIIIGSSSEVHNEVPLANYLTMLETIANWKW